MPEIVIDPAAQEWAYDQLAAHYKAGDRHVWVEVSESFYWQALEVLPPILHQDGRFMVGEPYDDNDAGAVHAGFAQVGSRYFALYCPVCDFPRACRELRSALSRSSSTPAQV